MATKLHPVAKSSGFKTNAAFYKKYPTHAHYLADHPQDAQNGPSQPQGAPQTDQPTPSMGKGGKTNPQDLDSKYYERRAADSTWAAQQLRSGNSTLVGASNPNQLPDGSIPAPSGISRQRDVNTLDAYEAARKAYKPAISTYFPNGFSPALPQATLGFGYGGKVMGIGGSSTSASDFYPTNKMYTQGDGMGLYYAPRDPYEGFENFGAGTSNIQSPGWQGDYHTPAAGTNPGSSRSQGSNWHTNESTDYSIDSVRMKQGGSINPYSIVRPNIQGQMLYNTPLPNKPIFPSTKNGGISRFDTGGTQAPPTMDHSYIGLNTSGLVTAGIAGADALVTNAIYNPQVRAQEAQLRRNLMTPITTPNQFYGQGMGQYGEGGITPDNRFLANPGSANALVESQEMLQLPNGSVTPVTGQEFHNDREDGMGGKYMNLPDSTKVLSKQKMLDKDFASEIAGKKITRKMSPADLAKPFNTKLEDGVLNNKLSDIHSVTTAGLIKGIKNSKVDDIYNGQEYIKDPEGTARRMMFGGTMVAGYGGKVLDPGGFIGPPPPEPYTQPNYGPVGPPAPESDNRYVMHQPGSGPVGPYTDYGEFVSNGETGKHNMFAPGEYDPAPYGSQPGDGTSVGPPTPKPGPTNGQRAMNWVGNHIDSNLGGLGMYAPELVGSINAMTHTPIFEGRYQSNYVGSNEVNVQSDLNRNLSMSYPATQRTTGNAAVDSARRGSTLATLIDSANSIGQYKSNFDTTQRTQRDITNAGISNQASMTNLGLADKMSTMMNQRKAIEDKSFENIANSIYAKSADARQYGQSKAFMNQLYSDWTLDGNNNLVPKNNKYPWHVGYGSSDGGLFTDGDGKRDKIVKKLPDGTVVTRTENNKGN